MFYRIHQTRNPHQSLSLWKKSETPVRISRNPVGDQWAVLLRSLRQPQTYHIIPLLPPLRYKASSVIIFFTYFSRPTSGIVYGVDILCVCTAPHVCGYISEDGFIIWPSLPNYSAIYCDCQCYISLILTCSDICNSCSNVHCYYLFHGIAKS